MTCPSLPFSLASNIVGLLLSDQVKSLERYWAMTPSNLHLSRKVIANR